jgi:cytochrome c556
MKIRFGLAVALFSVVAAGFAYGDINEDVIKMRQRLMDANGAAARIAVTMAKGDAPFDAVIAAAAMLSISHDNDVLPNLFPAGTETGETKAGPAIWSDNAAFKALSAKMVVDAKAAAEAAAQGLEAFKKAMGPVGANCQACHEKYRQS